MKLETLFNVYKHCRDQMGHYRGLRGYSFGIATEQDDWAVKFQKYQKLARKLELKVAKVKYCSLCGSPKGLHFFNCKRRMK